MQNMPLGQPELDGVKEITLLDHEIIESILVKIQSIKPFPTKISEINSIICLFVANTNKSELITRTLIVICSIINENNITANDIVDTVTDNINENGNMYGWDDKVIATFNQNKDSILKLLSLPQLLNVAKTLDLSLEYQNLFRKSKLLTDIRPVFNSEGTDITSSVVTFILRLYYENRKGSKSISIALDKKDVLELMSHCERALMKAEKIVELIKINADTSITISGEEDV